MLKAKEYQNLMLLPFNWNILTYLAIINPKSLASLPNYEEFQVPNILDDSQKTPLHYLLAHSNINSPSLNYLIRYITDYLEARKNDSHNVDVIKSLSPLIPLIIARSQPTIAEKLINQCLSNSPAYGVINTDQIPQYGSPAGGESQSNAIYSDSPELSKEIIEKTYQEKGGEMITFSSVLLNLDYNLISDDMLGLAWTLYDCDKDEILKTKVVTTLSDYLWKSSLFVHYILAVFYSALIILLSGYIGSDSRNIPLEAIILILSCGFLFIEIPQLQMGRLKYFTNVWNIVDLLFFMLVNATIIYRFITDENDLTRHWLYTSCIILGYLRWISYFRLVNSLSKKKIYDFHLTS